MNYPAMRWAVEECRLEGAPKPILFVIAYRADRDTGECWAGQRRIAREAGIARSTVQLWLPRLVGMGVLELVEEGSGPRADCYRILEGEVIHSPAASGPIASPVEVVAAELVDRSGSASGPIGAVWPPLVDRSAEVTGPTTSPLSSGNGFQGFEVQGSLDSREVQVVGGGSTADAAAADVYEPPPVSDTQKAWLASRGLGPKRPPAKSKSGQEQAEGVER
jgi:hypothetical protein